MIASCTGVVARTARETGNGSKARGPSGIEVEPSGRGGRRVRTTGGTCGLGFWWLLDAIIGPCIYLSVGSDGRTRGARDTRVYLYPYLPIGNADGSPATANESRMQRHRASGLGGGSPSCQLRASASGTCCWYARTHACLRLGCGCSLQGPLLAYRRANNKPEPDVPPSLSVSWPGPLTIVPVFQSV